MSLQIIVDMNLTPDWVPVLQSEGWTAGHWSVVGDPRATDQAIMEWASDQRHVVLTHDLDFGTILALTHASGPSVIQLRADDVLPAHLAPLLVAALRQHENALATGTLLVVDEKRLRLRILPL